GGSSAVTSRSVSASSWRASSRRAAQAGQVAKCVCTSSTSAAPSSPSSNACSVPSSTCGMLYLTFHIVIRIDQAASRAGQRSSYRALGEPQCLGDLVVVEALRLEQEGLPIALVELLQRGPHSNSSVAPLDHVVRRRRGRLQLVLEELESTALAQGLPGILPDQVQRHREKPRPRIPRRRRDCPGEGLLCNILRPITIAGSAPKHPDQRVVVV